MTVDGKQHGRVDRSAILMYNREGQGLNLTLAIMLCPGER